MTTAGPIESTVQLLKTEPVVSVVGFRGSGKSHAAAMLSKRLDSGESRVLHQNARAWLSQGGAGVPVSSDPSVDSDVVAALESFASNEAHWTWIVDDADTMLAYTADHLLHTIRQRVRLGNLSMVMLRNRFVNEGEGWFQHQLETVAGNAPLVTMNPLSEEEALGLARSRFHGWQATMQAKWLVEWSGGIPGVMDELYPLTPLDGGGSTIVRVIDLASSLRRRLGLDRKVIRDVIGMHMGRLLPSPVFLSPLGRTSLGLLKMCGAIPTDYQDGDRLVQGRFFEHVLRATPAQQHLSAQHIEAGLRFELLLCELPEDTVGMEDFGLRAGSETVLSHSIAASLHCQAHFSSLVRPTGVAIGETLGRSTLKAMLKSCNVTPPVNLGAVELAEVLLDHLERSDAQHS